MAKFLLLFLSLVVVGQCCNYAKLETIDRLMERFLSLVEEKKYKYEAALLAHELMNYNEVDFDQEPEEVIMPLSSDGLLGAKMGRCDHALWSRKSDRTVMACQNKQHLNGLTFAPSPEYGTGRGQFTEAVCCLAK